MVVTMGKQPIGDCEGQNDKEFLGKIVMFFFSVNFLKLYKKKIFPAWQKEKK